MMDCAISSTQIDMRIYTVAETKTLYFKWDYSLCDFVVQAQKILIRKSGDFFFVYIFVLLYRDIIQVLKETLFILLFR